MRSLFRIFDYLDNRDTPKSWRIGSFAFLRLLGFIYCVAFVDLWFQIVPLIGENGIEPYHVGLQSLSERIGWISVDRIPTILWFFHEDWILHVICGCGLVASILIMIGVLQGFSILIAWILYLSLVNAGGNLISNMGDLLLVEVSVISLLVAPWRIYIPYEKWDQPTRIARWLFRWLLFRVMFESGVIKITSEDPIWYPEFMGMSYYYFTQAQPNWIAWFFYNLPNSIHKISTLAILGVQLVGSFCILGSGIYRWIAFSLISLIQFYFFIIGSSGFIHLLIIGLSFFLVDDFSIKKLLHLKEPNFGTASLKGGRRFPQIAISSLFLIAIFPGSILNLAKSFYPYWPIPQKVSTLYETKIAPFRIINSYSQLGLVKGKREEIIIQGSMDGFVWKDYELLVKPGSTYRRPYFMFFHNPRLDSQFWYLSLGPWHQNFWLVNLMDKVLLSDKRVHELFFNNPFPTYPPKYLRAIKQDYVFTSVEERRRYGDWWKKGESELYTPVMSSR